MRHKTNLLISYPQDVAAVASASTSHNEWTWVNLRAILKKIVHVSNSWLVKAEAMAADFK